MPSDTAKPGKGLHPRNLHRQGYDFVALQAHAPALAAFVRPNPYGNLSIDYADPQAVIALNTALLAYHYGIQHWRIPDGALCPPIPGRVDYLHHMATLLELPAPGQPTAAPIAMLDIGTGANGIYPLLAAQVYGWHCVASDINADSLANVSRTVAGNPTLKARIELRLQTDRHHIFTGVIQPGERYDISVCNPPFHASEAAAQKANQRKVHNLSGRQGQPNGGPFHDRPLNFGGNATELWCKGGEKLFLRKMARESEMFKRQCRWFTSLVSNSDNVKPTEKLLRKLGTKEVRTIEMHQGQKITRVLAWRYV